MVLDVAPGRAPRRHADTHVATMQKPDVSRNSHRLRGRPSSSDSEQAGNRTMLVGLEVLRAVGHMSAPATLTEIARAIGMPVTRTSRYLASLTRADFLRHNPSTGRFELGPAIIELGVRALALMDEVRLATEHMGPLTASTELVSILYVWGSHGPTAIKWEWGPVSVPVRMREGLNVSVVTTAAGRVFLAYLDEAQVRPILKRDLRAWNSSSPKKKFTLNGITAMRRQIRRAGMASAEGLSNAALSALAAPVFGPNGQLIMSLALVGAVGTFDTSESGKPAKQLKAVAARLSRMFGGIAALKAAGA